MYEYRATILRHIDADTSWVSVDLGFDCAIKLTVRWARINAPEKNTTDGEAALHFVRMMLPEQSRCILRTIKDKREKFGRYLGEFILNDGTNLNEVLLREGFAEPYFVTKESETTGEAA
ncbi:MAG: thermonuclease family protein [Chloroflexota bacterium]|nr:thermonuclease family protein [Chloroflexota bacterium]